VPFTLSASVEPASATEVVPTLADPLQAAPYGVVVLALGAAMVAVVLVSWSACRWLRTAAWQGRLPWRLGALPVEDRASHDPPRGYKVARLVVDPGGGAGGFLGLTVGGLYGADTSASCEVLQGSLPPPRRLGRRARPRQHDAPDLGCTCGFYAFQDRAGAEALLSTRPPVSRLFGLALLEVDLAGTVIEFDRGFRASRQRVLGVGVPPWCVPCATAGRARRAQRFAGLAGRNFEEACHEDLPRHPPLYRFALMVHHAALVDRLAGRAALRAVCDEHTPRDGAAPTGAATTGGAATGGADTGAAHTGAATTGGAATGGAATGGATTASGAGAETSPALVLELPDLAAQLGTEVRWLDDERFDVDGFVDAMSWLPPGSARST
jgi:hypothetical protein